MEDNKNTVGLYPSYWIYNAGIVGILRALNKNGLKDGNDFKIENNSLLIPPNTWGELLQKYPIIMLEHFGTSKSEWFNRFFSNKGTPLFQNNIDSNQISGNTFTFLLKKNKLTETETIFLFLLAIESTGNAKKNILDLKKNKALKTVRAKIEFLINLLKKRVEEIRKIIDEKGNKKTYGNFKSLRNILKNETEFKKIKNQITSFDIDRIDKINIDEKNISEIINSAGNEYISNNLPKKIENIIGRFACSFCGAHTDKENCFDLTWFNFEGGSVGEKGFPNFYWKGSTQQPICGNCRLVLLYSPFGIYPDSHIYQGEFINIPDIKLLYRLNEYRINKYRIKKTVKKKPGEEKPDEEKSDKKKPDIEISRLVDAVVSTGAYLQLQSRWMLQNIEIIELCGKRNSSVYTLHISPVPLKLLSDYKTTALTEWLNLTEKVKVQYVKNNLYNKWSINSKKYSRFMTGREIIELFLKDDTGSLIKTAIFLFKLYFEVDQNGKRINSFKMLVTNTVKPLLLLILSLLHHKEYHSDYFQLGKEIGKFFKDSGQKENQKNDDFEKKVLPILFNCVYTLRKNDFVERILRLYMERQCEVDYRLLDIFRFDDIHFQTESLLLIIGILTKLNPGGYND